MSHRGKNRGIGFMIAQAREESNNIEQAYSRQRASLTDPSRPVTPAGSDGYEQRRPNDSTVPRARKLLPIQYTDKNVEKPTETNTANKSMISKEVHSLKLALYDIKDTLNSIESNSSIQSLNSIVPNLKTTVEKMIRLLKNDAYTSRKSHLDLPTC